MNITITDVFELNRVLHVILSQQLSYPIKTAFKIHSLINWLDDVERFVFERLSMLSDTSSIDFNNPLHKALLDSEMQFIGTDLTVDELLNTTDKVTIEVKDVGILKKIIPDSGG